MQYAHGQVFQPQVPGLGDEQKAVREQEVADDDEDLRQGRAVPNQHCDRLLKHLEVIGTIK